MFNGQRIVGLCKSFTVNAVNFLKDGKGSCLTMLKHFLTMSTYHTRSVIVNCIFDKHNRKKYNQNLAFNFAKLKFVL